MSFTKEKRNAIQHYLLEKIDAEDPDFIRKASDSFHVTDKTLYRYLHELTAHNILEKSGRHYRLHAEKHSYSLERSDMKNADEDRIYKQYVRDSVSDLPENVRDIWYYAFTEMMNNAIDHSEAKTIRFSVEKSYLSTTVIICDDGIGIFRKIKEYFLYETLDEAVHDLFKGKLTTDPEHHTGEGIFFTSRLLDQFAVISNGKLFTHDKYEELIADLKEPLASSGTDTLPGTFVFMRLSNFSSKSSDEVFEAYEDEDNSFTRTQIPLKNIYESWPVSRSEAKRLCRGFDRFLEVELDFTDIAKIGQGFAHELFVVWQNAHPEVRLIPVGANTAVRKMISHVLNTH